MEARDLVIIGGGPAGYVGAIRAAQLGGKVTLIEQDTLGGTCLNRGCIPTKALARGAEFLDLARKAKDYGVNLGTVEVDFTKMMTRKNIVVKTIVSGVRMLMEANSIEVLEGKARFLSPLEIETESTDGKKFRIKASKIVIATGCRWERPSVSGAEGIITTDQALTLKEIPQSLLVLGASDVGLTLATIFAKFGAAVTIAEKTTEILPGVDRELVRILERELKKNKINLHTETTLKSIKRGESANLSTKNGEVSLPAQYVLLAEGRKADVEGLGIEKTGVRLEAGRIMVNQKMETGVPGVFAAGDVTGGQLLAHVAMAEGKMAVENALGKDSEMDYHVVPLCIGTIPEIACIGLTEAEAAAKGYELKIGRFDFGANGLATVMGERTGLVKVISDAQYGQILGVHIIGPQASNLIPEAALAMKLEATPFEIGSTIHAHPTLSEAVMEAALNVDGETIHSLPTNKK